MRADEEITSIQNVEYCYKYIFVIFEQKKDELVRGWKNFHNAELHNLYSTPNKIRIIKSRMMRCARHLLRLG
jgi:hypothetical protein